jgi:phosphoribosylamine--glycine ligase
VLEYNVRFGDPECQPLMLRLESSLVDLFEACIAGRAKSARPVWSDDSAVCVVLSSEGYPGDYRRGDVIDGLAAAAGVEGVQIFHAGTSRNDDGCWITAGGRVLGVTARAKDLREAVARAYRAIEKIHWRGMHYRKDIAHRALRMGEILKP